MVRDIFDRLSGGQSVSEVALSELLLDPVTVDYLDSLTCYTLPVSPPTCILTFIHNTYYRTSRECSEPAVVLLLRQTKAHADCLLHCAGTVQLLYEVDCDILPCS